MSKIKVKSFMADVRKYLEERHGSVKPEWEANLFFLEDNLELYLQCKEQIKKDGIYNSVEGKKNQLLSTMKDLEAIIFKNIQHLGISPYATNKINDKEEDTTGDFIEGLVS